MENSNKALATEISESSEFCTSSRLKGKHKIRRSSLSVCVYVMSILSLVSHGFNCQKVARTKYFVVEMTFFDTADLFLTCFYPP